LASCCCIRLTSSPAQAGGVARRRVHTCALVHAAWHRTGRARCAATQHPHPAAAHADTKGSCSTNSHTHAHTRGTHGAHTHLPTGPAAPGRAPWRAAPCFRATARAAAPAAPAAAPPAQQPAGACVVRC
jgi:hypothetical protein